MEAKTKFDRFIACSMAAGMGWLPIVGFVNNFSAKIDPGFNPFIKHVIIQEIFFVLSAFFVCAFLYYLLGNQSWLRPHVKKYALHAALIAFAVDIFIMTAFITNII